MKRQFRGWCSVFFALCMLVPIFALRIGSAETVQATSGNGKDTVRFFAESYGNAKIWFRQTEGQCYELSYTHMVDGLQGDEEEWGKYHITVRTPSGYEYTEDWDDTFGNETYVLKLPNAGRYMITVTPFTQSEMTASWLLDKFNGWSRQPSWWIDSCENCQCSSNLSVSVYVQKVDQDTGAVLHERSETLQFGNNTVTAGTTPSDYQRTSDSSISVYVDMNGRPDRNTVTFYYKRKNPGRQDSGSSSNPVGSKTAWISINCYGTDDVWLKGNNLELSPGTYTITPDFYETTYNGSKYSITGARSYSVTVYSDGTATSTAFNFYYEKQSRNNSHSSGSGLYGLAKQKLATRYGPSTKYEDGGTYNVAGQYIRILSRAYDRANGIWWVKCEIPYRNEIRVLWTGYKRFDSSTIPLDSIPIE